MDVIVDKVQIPVFAENADATAWTAPDSGASTGVYFADDVWNNNSADNPLLQHGVTEGIARSVDYNTVMRQCTVMARLFAQILAYRNSLTRTDVSTPYADGDSPANIGTSLLSSETTMDQHIGAMAEIFASGNFLADNEVVERTIAAAAVTTDKIADSAIVTAKIANESVVCSKLGADLITTGSSSANGITVSLSQSDAEASHGFVIKIECTKVDSAKAADKATDAANIKTNTSTSNLYLCGTTSTAANTYKALYNSSNVYISNGTQLNATDFNVTSDERLKENIHNVGHNQVRKLVEGVDVKTFNYKDTPDRTTLGVIAQDLKATNTVLGDLLVFEDADTKMLGIHENKLVYVLWDYIKQQNAHILELEEKLNLLLSR